MTLTWTDWRGNDYTVGDHVLYARASGRSVEMAEGIVADLYVMYRTGRYEWARLDEGAPVPEKLVQVMLDAAGNETRWTSNAVARAPRMKPVETERRAKVIPLRTSRFRTYSWRAEHEKDKPVTLTVTESITAIKPLGREPRDRIWIRPGRNAYASRHSQASQRSL